MNISEIARLAGVSKSTVSKVMNGKDESISEQTRERVLTTAKQYNYSPYAAIIAQKKRSFNISVIISGNDYSPYIISGLVEAAGKHGYSITVLKSEQASPAAFEQIAASNTDAVLVEQSDAAKHSELSQAGIPVHFFSTASDEALSINYEAFSYAIMNKICKKAGHRSIACIASQEDARAKAFLRGYSEFLFENNITDLKNTAECLNRSIIDRIKSGLISAVVCESYEAAMNVLSKLSSINCDIPKELSIISVVTSSEAKALHPKICGVLIPYEQFGAFLAESIIDSLEKKSGSPAAFNAGKLSIYNSAAVYPPFSGSRKKVIVVGSINVDTYLNFDILPTSGNTVITNNSACYPGGKGTNTSVGVSRLGHRAELLGAVGNDPDSEIIFQALLENNVKYSNIEKHNAQTGKAFILTDKSGDSLISILSGANNLMDEEFIEKNEASFRDALYCLLNAEIPPCAIYKSCEIAHRHGAKTVLKAASYLKMDERLLKQIDIFVPNLSELDFIIPENIPTDTKLEKLLKLGAKTIILTLGADGCILKTATETKKFNAAPFKSVDNTGACDAFISALVSYLIYGCSIYDAVKIANIAAGFAISKEGVVPALVDKVTLESYIKQNAGDIRLPQIISRK